MNYSIFKCLFCGYSAQVQGESYFDEGSYKVMQTKVCNGCKTLFEDLYDLPIEWVILNGKDPVSLSKALSLSPHHIGTGCLKCSKPSSTAWSKNKPVCPKCNKLMTLKYNGNLPSKD